MDARGDWHPGCLCFSSDCYQVARGLAQYPRPDGLWLVSNWLDHRTGLHDGSRLGAIHTRESRRGCHGTSSGRRLCNLVDTDRHPRDLHLPCIIHGQTIHLVGI